ncbi:MAG TPA: nicotinamide mononucleotide transporter family protein, partial [Burkholderiaceae bacterium]|nr:nicotinamide mononucleotide transporter family protein [Burkholderiaceae bacterium]
MDGLLQAARPLFEPAFVALGAPVSWVECIAFALAIGMVLLNIRVNPWAWPLAIASSLLYGALFWDSRLYGEASLQGFFVAVALWGWWQWLRGTADDGTALRVRRLPSRQRRALMVALAL